MPVPFRKYFTEIADAETRSARIFEEHPSGLPPGEYGFLEFYCDEKNCDCRRVHLMVIADWSKEPIAMIAYGWETPAYYAKWMHSADKQMAAEMSGTMLEPFFNQSKYAAAAKKLCEDAFLADPSYVERLKRHYRMMRDHVDGLQRSVQRREKKQKKPKQKPREMVFPKERIPIPELVSTEAVRQALLSPHEAVRNSASFFFSGCRADGLSADIMKTIIQSVELYGIIASLGVLESLEVPQDETTVLWLSQELSKNHDLEDIRLDNYCYFLTEILCQADPKLLMPEMADLPCFSEECAGWLFKRIELAQTDWETLWQKLLDSWLYDAEDNDDPHFDIDDLLVEAVSRHDACNQRVLDWLQRKDVPLDDEDVEDFIPVLLQIVAKNHIAEAKEFVLDGILKSNEFYLPEGGQEAFASIAEEDDWEMLYSRWKDSPKRHLWFFDLLTEKPSQRRLEIALDMLRIIGKDISNDWLITFLLENYVKESHASIVRFLEEDLVSPEYRCEHAVELVISGIINPDSLDDFYRWFHFAEENEWNLSGLQTQHAEERLRVTYSEVFDFGDDEDDDDDFDEEYYNDDDMDDGNENERSIPLSSLSMLRDFTKRQPFTTDFEDDSDDDYGPPQPYRRTEPQIGRNDPCPCGSGKKYKKCCMEK